MSVAFNANLLSLLREPLMLCRLAVNSLIKRLPWDVFGALYNTKPSSEMYGETKRDLHMYIHIWAVRT